MARGRERGSPSNPEPTEREVGGFEPSKVPEPYISRELTVMSRLRRKLEEMEVF